MYVSWDLCLYIQSHCNISVLGSPPQAQEAKLILHGLTIGVACYIKKLFVGKSNHIL